MKTFHWNLETLNYLKQFDGEELKDQIAAFVWENCTLEDGETFDDLARSLLFTIMFGEEFMESEDKGTLKEYEE